MKKVLFILFGILVVSSPLTYAYRDLETGTFLTRDPIGYGDGPNLYCYVHCNPITSFDAWGLETVEQYQAQIDEVDQQYGEEYGSHRSEHWSADNKDNEYKGWDSQESYDQGKEILKNWRVAKAPLQSARDAIIQSTRAFNEAFGKEIADGEVTALDPLKIDDDFMDPSDLAELAHDKRVEKLTLNTAKTMAKYYVIAKMLTSITGTSEAPNCVPDGWKSRPTRGKGGTEYYNPENPNESIRVMPGNPNSPYKNSQSSYVVNRDNSGSSLDVDGNRVPKKSSEGHIPLDTWQDKK